MMPSLQDLPALARPLIVLAAVVALSAGGIAYTGKLVERGKVDLTAAQAKLKEAHQRVARSGEEVDTLRAYTGPYQQLQRSGIVGEEQRLNWIEALRVANVDARLYGVDYEVATQNAYAFAQQVNAGNLPVQQSIMKLKLGLLYETDLLAFFKALAEQDVGIFSVNQCQLQRLISDVSRPVNQPTLRAECEVAWVTIAPYVAPEERS